MLKDRLLPTVKNLTFCKKENCLSCEEIVKNIIAEIPEITEAFCIQNQLEWAMREDITGFQFLCDAINKKIRGEK